MAGDADHVENMAMIHFCFDDVASSPTLGYPNLAKPGLAPDDFDLTWPRTIPLRLLMYLRHANIAFSVHSMQDAPPGSWYPVAMAWHDHAQDYFALMSEPLQQRMRQGQVRVLFYYHEGDNPAVMHNIMEQHRHTHDLPEGCYLFVCANSAAQRLRHFWYFDDHEYFFRYINRRQTATPATEVSRPFRFTALNRTHKWWRASVMADLVYQEVLDHSLWSYNTQCSINDCEQDNPLELDSRPQWRSELARFMSAGPYVCDSLDSAAHNDHRRVAHDLYQDSYCHLIFETHFDADGSAGAFLTEKTYKCIKFGQPFVLIGCAGSLAALRAQGYRVFDHAIDNRYDEISNNTARWNYLRRVIRDLSRQDLHAWYLDCLADVQHNQIWFEQRWRGLDLEALAQQLTAHHYIV
jgi:hypothetical protein